MSQVLYRKYRSQTFDELIGQAHITDILKKAVINGAISHAYLFVGSRGTGKTSTARILAKAINCHNITKEGNPCNQCESCKAITDGTFLDLIEIDAASNRGIDQIRELKERIEFSPVEGKYKTYIIDEVHMLTTEAFNALLKTLEEPPAHVVFILATTDAHKLPATILSRCQRYDFHLGSEEQVAHVIKVSSENEGIKLSQGALDLIAQNAKGSYRDALSLLDVVVSGQLESDKPNEVSENEVRSALGVPDSTMVYYLLEKIVYGEGKEALALIKELDTKGVNFQQFIQLTLETLRGILIDKIQGNEDSEYSFASSLHQNDIVRLITQFIEAEKQLRTASLPSLVLELIIAQSMLSTGDEVKTLSERTKKPVRSKPTPNNDGGDLIAKEKRSDKEVADEEFKNSDKKLSDIKTKDTKDSSTTVEKSIKKSKKENKAKDLKNINVLEKEEDVNAKDPNSNNKKNQIADGDSSELFKDDPSEKNEIEEVLNNEIIDNNSTDSDETDQKIQLKIEDIENCWPEIIKGIQKYNGHLYAFLKAAKVTEIDGSYLVLEVPFNFHKERIESPKSREAINDVFQEIMGSKIAIRCDVNETIQRKKESTADVVLKNIQSVANKVSSNSDNTSEVVKSSENRSTVKPRKVSKKIEAIFADL